MSGRSPFSSILSERPKAELAPHRIFGTTEVPHPASALSGPGAPRLPDAAQVVEVVRQVEVIREVEVVREVVVVGEVEAGPTVDPRAPAPPADAAPGASVDPAFLKCEALDLAARYGRLHPHLDEALAAFFGDEVWTAYLRASCSAAVGTAPDGTVMHDLAPKVTRLAVTTTARFSGVVARVAYAGGPLMRPMGPGAALDALESLEAAHDLLDDEGKAAYLAECRRGAWSKERLEGMGAAERAGLETLRRGLRAPMEHGLRRDAYDLARAAGLWSMDCGGVPDGERLDREAAAPSEGFTPGGEYPKRALAKEREEAGLARLACPIADLWPKIRRRPAHWGPGVSTEAAISGKLAMTIKASMTTKASASFAPIYAPLRWCDRVDALDQRRAAGGLRRDHPDAAKRFSGNPHDLVLLEVRPWDPDWVAATSTDPISWDGPRVPAGRGSAGGTASGASPSGVSSAVTPDAGAVPKVGGGPLAVGPDGRSLDTGAGSAPRGWSGEAPGFGPNGERRRGDPSRVAARMVRSGFDGGRLKRFDEDIGGETAEWGSWEHQVVIDDLRRHRRDGPAINSLTGEVKMAAALAERMVVERCEDWTLDPLGAQDKRPDAASEVLGPAEARAALRAVALDLEGAPEAPGDAGGLVARGLALNAGAHGAIVGGVSSTTSSPSGEKGGAGAGEQGVERTGEQGVRKTGEQRLRKTGEEASGPLPRHYRMEADAWSLWRRHPRHAAMLDWRCAWNASAMFDEPDWVDPDRPRSMREVSAPSEARPLAPAPRPSKGGPVGPAFQPDERRRFRIGPFLDDRRHPDALSGLLAVMAQAPRVKAPAPGEGLAWRGVGAELAVSGLETVAAMEQTASFYGGANGLSTGAIRGRIRAASCFWSALVASSMRRLGHAAVLDRDGRPARGVDGLPTGAPRADGLALYAPPKLDTRVARYALWRDVPVAYAWGYGPRELAEGAEWSRWQAFGLVAVEARRLRIEADPKALTPEMAFWLDRVEIPALKAKDGPPLVSPKVPWEASGQDHQAFTVGPRVAHVRGFHPWMELRPDAPDPRPADGIVFADRHSHADPYDRLSRRRAGGHKHRKVAGSTPQERWPGVPGEYFDALGRREGAGADALRREMERAGIPDPGSAERMRVKARPHLGAGHGRAPDGFLDVAPLDAPVVEDGVTTRVVRTRGRAADALLNCERDGRQMPGTVPATLGSKGEPLPKPVFWRRGEVADDDPIRLAWRPEEADALRDLEARGGPKAPLGLEAMTVLPPTPHPVLPYRFLVGDDLERWRAGLPIAASGVWPDVDLDPAELAPLEAGAAREAQEALEMEGLDRDGRFLAAKLIADGVAIGDVLRTDDEEAHLGGLAGVPGEGAGVLEEVLEWVDGVEGEGGSAAGLGAYAGLLESASGSSEDPEDPDDPESAGVADGDAQAGGGGEGDGGGEGGAGR